MSKISDKVEALARPVVEEEGCKLWSVEYIKEAGTWYLRIFIDKDGGVGIADWTAPRGGYFLSFNTLPGCAKKVVEMCGEYGVKFTPAGASFPYGYDPEDKNIRLAPSFATVEEITQAIKVLCLCTKLAAIEKLMKERT